MSLLNFKLFNGVLKATENGKNYHIIQNNDGCCASVDGVVLECGNLYECLESCNRHSRDSLIEILDLDVLAGCKFTVIQSKFFQDHTGQDVIAHLRRFKSLDQCKEYINQHKEDAVVYVHSLKKCSDLNKIYVHNRPIEYWLCCCVRRK